MIKNTFAVMFPRLVLNQMHCFAVIIHGCLGKFEEIRFEMFTYKSAAKLPRRKEMETLMAKNR